MSGPEELPKPFSTDPGSPDGPPIVRTRDDIDLGIESLFRTEILNQQSKELIMLTREDIQSHFMEPSDFNQHRVKYPEREALTRSAAAILVLGSSNLIYNKFFGKRA